MTYEQLRQVLEAEERPPTIVLLPNSSRTVAVPTVLRRETLWTGVLPEAWNAVPNKPALTLGDRCWYPEFILVRLLEAAGWSAVFRKNFKGRAAFWTDIETPLNLPPAQRTQFAALSPGLTNGGGCWDVIAWRGDETVFIESKQRGNDTLNANQRRWLGHALGTGIVPLESFLIAEYSMPRKTSGDR
jgi:hypothetical protein